MMGGLALRLDKESFTYADILEMDERVELIEGKLYMMAPPSTRHQLISAELFFQLKAYVQGKPCQVIAAPFGVRLFPRAYQQDDTFVEPDMVVVCDAAKLDEWGCNGAPDLIIEILSPSNAEYDKEIKFYQYQKAGVLEYWIVNPWNPSVQVNILKKGRYLTFEYPGIALVPVSVLPGCVINLKEVF
ncbi:MAG: Uma2 family endonuclease [Treponema sp.]|nr:Uma2 family endonuclease [Treponema sp.]